MSMKQKKDLTKQQQNKNLPLVTFIVSLFGILYMNMIYYLNSPIPVSGQLLLLLRCVLILFTFLFVLTRLRSITVDKYSVLWIGTLLYVWSLFSSLSNLELYGNPLQTIADQSLWFVCLCFLDVYFGSEKKINTKRLRGILCVGFFVFTIRYLVQALLTGFASVSVNCIYYGLLLLPTAMLTKKLWLRISMISIATAITLLSSKRTAFIILVAIVMIPLLIDLLKGNKNHTVALILVGAIAIFLVYKYVTEHYDIVLFDRFANLGEDQGSGRFGIYQRVYAAIKESDLLGFLAGHGFNSIYLNQVVGSSAHNDFLEVAYDFGLVGLILYVMLFLKLIQNAFRLYKQNSEYASAYVSALIAFLCMSVFSHLILYPTYITFLFIFFSLGINDLKTKEKEREDKKAPKGLPTQRFGI